jgi:(S)-ureidoglycine-glyoxylate aminotransferase
MLYCARECALQLLDEGIDHSIERHTLAGNAMLAGVENLNLKLFGDISNKMTNVVGVYIPECVEGEAIRHSMLHDFNIEIGTSFGPLQGKIWRIGTMGYNARPDAVYQTLQSLETVLRRAGHKLAPGEAVDAAYKVYSDAHA